MHIVLIIVAIASFGLCILNFLSKGSTSWTFNKNTSANKSAYIYLLIGVMCLIFLDTSDNKNKETRSVAQPAVVSIPTNTEVVNESEKSLSDNSQNISSQDEKMFIKIKNKVKRDYPENYTVQKMIYEDQVKSYYYMKTVTDLKIKRKVQNEYPMEFITQKIIYNQEIDARESMK